MSKDTYKLAQNAVDSDLVGGDVKIIAMLKVLAKRFTCERNKT